jgi:type II secretory pathway component GspD/PulD (secretin)
MGYPKWSCAVAFLLSAALVGGGASVTRGQAKASQEPKAGGEKPGVGAAKDENGLQVKTFRLRHADPEEVRQILAQVWTTMPQVKPPVGFKPGVPTAGAPRVPRFAVDTRSRTLFVRGTDKEVAMAVSLVSILDTEPGQPIPESKDLRVLRLQHAKVDQATAVLTALGLQIHTVPLRKTNALVILSPSDANVAAIRDVIESLDVEGQRDVPLPRNKIGKKPASGPGD